MSRCEHIYHGPSRQVEFRAERDARDFDTMLERLGHNCVEVYCYEPAQSDGVVASSSRLWRLTWCGNANRPMPENHRGHGTIEDRIGRIETWLASNCDGGGRNCSFCKGDCFSVAE